MHDDPLTDPAYTAVDAALADLQDAMNDPATKPAKVEELRAALVKALRRMDEADADPDPPEAIPRDLPAEVVAGLTAATIADTDAAGLLATLRRNEAEAQAAGGLHAGPVALQKAMRHADRDERAPAELLEAATRELDREQRAARRTARMADAEQARAVDAGDRAEAREARLLSEEAEKAATRTERRRAKLAGAQHHEPRTDWTGKPPDREWLLQGWLAVGRVHLLTGAGGRGKSRLTLQLAAALASCDKAWPVPYRTAHPSFKNHPPTLSPTEAGGMPVVVASWEDEAEEVHRRLRDGPVPVKSLGDRLNFVDCAEWGPLWAPQEGGSRHVQTMAELTPAGRRLRRVCEEKGARLLVIDPLAAAYGSDENVRGLVRQFMASWDAWGRNTGCAVLMIGHPPKQGTNQSGDDRWSGSTDWPAAARSAWAMRHDPPKEATQRNGKAVPAQPERTWIECWKPSYGPIPDPVYLEADGVAWYATRRQELKDDEAKDGATVAAKVPGV